MFATAPTVSRFFAGAAGALLFTGACLSVAAGPANAQAAPRSEVVQTRDLNLAAPAGRETFEHRVRAAATRVCGDAAGDLAARSQRSRCLKAAIDTATAQVSTAAPSAN